MHLSIKVRKTTYWVKIDNNKTNLITMNMWLCCHSHFSIIFYIIIVFWRFEEIYESSGNIFGPWFQPDNNEFHSKNRNLCKRRIWNRTSASKCEYIYKRVLYLEQDNTVTCSLLLDWSCYCLFSLSRLFSWPL
jgi:hypothetical protein